MREFLPMVLRRFSPPPPRAPHPPAAEFVFGEGTVAQWIGFVGDLSPLPGRAARYAPEVQAFFAGCDLIVGNLEGVITRRRWRPYLHKHTPRLFESLVRLHPLERWVLSVANNHAADYGRADLERTLTLLEGRGIRWVGAAARPRLALFPGVTLSAWTWWVNGRSDAVVREDPGVPGTSGLHIAFPHWGYEHERRPRPEQRSRLPRGYGLVVGHHSHLPQPPERQGERLIAWSLGNFLTAKRLPVLGEGAILKVGIGPDARGTPRMMCARFQEICLDRSDRRYCRVVPRTEP